MPSRAVRTFPHSQNSWELGAMVDAGMSKINALKAAISVAGQVLRYDIGQVKPKMLADLTAVEGNAVVDRSSLRPVKFIMKGGLVYKQ
ncbi:MAG: hypothetical protein ACJ74Y_13075 [Bryobacteraceae bacterium]